MHQPTERVIRILESVTASKEGKRLSDFSAELDIPKSTLLPILATLCERHYLAREFERYYPGAALFSLSRACEGAAPIMDCVRRELTSLVERFGETCYFGVADGGEVLYLDKVDSPNPLRMLTSIGKRLPAYATGIGKALLMGKSESELRAIYPNGLTPLTGKTITDLSVLWEQLADAERRGYSSEVEESTEFIRCFAVPVRRLGRTVAAISIAIPTFRYDGSRRDETIAALRESADRLGKMLEATDGDLNIRF